MSGIHYELYRQLRPNGTWYLCDQFTEKQQLDKYLAQERFLDGKKSIQATYRVVEITAKIIYEG